MSLAAIGLDIGTALARAAVHRRGAPVLIAGDGGTPAIPAAVSVDGQRVLAGSGAIRRLITHPHQTVRSVKHVLGEEQLVLRRMRTRPDRMLASLIRELRDRAKEQHPPQANATVLGAAPWFREAERQALVAGAKRMGLQVMRVIAEPTAVALSVLPSEDSGEQRRIAVVDVGAGGVSASVLRVSPRSVMLGACCSAGGVGGDAVDAVLVDAARAQLRRQGGRKIEERSLREMLRQACESAKQDLAVMKSTTVHLQWLPPAHAGNGPARIEFDQASLTAALGRLLDKVQACCVGVMAASRVLAGQLDCLYLCGGMTRVPAVRNRAEEIFGLPGAAGLHPDGSVALGAIVLADAMIRRRELEVREANIMSERSEVPELALYRREAGLERGGPLGQRAERVGPSTRDEEQSDAATTQGASVSEATRPRPGEAPGAAPRRDERREPEPRKAVEPQRERRQDERREPEPRKADEPQRERRQDERREPEPTEPQERTAAFDQRAEEKPSDAARRTGKRAMAKLREAAAAPKRAAAAEPAGAEPAPSERSDDDADRRAGNPQPEAAPAAPDESVGKTVESMAAKLAEARRLLAAQGAAQVAASRAVPGAAPAPAIPALAALSRGTIRNPRDVPELVDLALARALEPEDLEPVALAVLLSRILTRRSATGTLTLDRGDDQVRIDIVGGVARAGDRELSELRRAFNWPDATYAFDERKPNPAGRPRVSLVHIAADGLRNLCRSWTTEQLLEGLGDRLSLAPVVDPEREQLLGRLGLDKRERRFVESNLDGTMSTRQVVDQGGIGKSTALQVVVVLAAFGCVEFMTVAAREGQSLADQIDELAARMRRANHFDALGVHWSALPEQIEEAYQQLCQRVAKGGEWDSANPDGCEQIRQRAEQAYEVLSDKDKRLAHRHEQYGDLDTDALADLMHKRGQALKLKGAERELEETLSKRTELAAWRSKKAQEGKSPKRAGQPHPRRAVQPADSPAGAEQPAAGGDEPDDAEQ